MQWHRWFPGDYIRDTGALSLTEHGAYRVLLDHYYSTDGKLKADMVALFRICRAMEQHEQDAVGRVVKEFFTVSAEGKLCNKRADKEMAEMAEFAAKSKARGMAGANARWSNKDASSNANAMHKQCLEGSQPQPQPQRNTKPKSNANAIAFALPDWIPSQPWADFVETRTKLRAPLTDKAKTLAIAELGKLRDQGHDPRAVLEQSVFKGWRGLFPPKTQNADTDVDHFAGAL